MSEVAKTTRALLNKIEVACRCGTFNEVKVGVEHPSLFQCTVCTRNSVVKLEAIVQMLDWNSVPQPQEQGPGLNSSGINEIQEQGPGEV